LKKKANAHENKKGKSPSNQREKPRKLEGGGKVWDGRPPDIVEERGTDQESSG